MSYKIIHIHDEDSVADTCRKEVLPKLYDSEWTDDLIFEQRTFTDGKIIVIGRKAISLKIAWPRMTWKV
ncbi:MAG TPA: hypothetical protein ENI20_00085 [Bacteroides sp.]|nr:hypothetical protein [Bacteroides sp.]